MTRSKLTSAKGDDASAKTISRPDTGLAIRSNNRADHADPDRDLLRSIGRRRIVMLRSGAVSVEGKWRSVP